MKKFIVTTSLFIFMCIWFVQRSSAEIYTTVSGRVTAEETGKGIANVAVNIWGGRGDGRGAITSTKTDNEGRYILKDVLSGTHYLSFFPPEDSPYVLKEGLKIDVIKGKHLININQKLKVGGLISGTVYDSDGKTPVSGLKISADCPIASENDSVGKFADTDSNGNYIMRGFDESDKCTIKMMQSGHYNMARIVAVKNGQTTKVNFIMKWNDVTGISGVVTGVDSQPLQGAKIVLIKKYKVAEAYTDASGRYSIFGIPPGIYDASVIHPHPRLGYGYITKQDVVIEESKSTIVDFKFGYPETQSNLGLIEKILTLLTGNNAYAYPPPLPESRGKKLGRFYLFDKQKPTMKEKGTGYFNILEKRMI